MPRCFLLVCLFAVMLRAQTPEQVLVLVNSASPLSRSIGEYYVLRRSIPLDHLLKTAMPLAEEITRDQYDKQIAVPVASYLRSRGLAEKILYIAATGGVPLKIGGKKCGVLDAYCASVDSELAMLYADMHRGPHPLSGPLRNPFFGKTSARFRHPDFPIYLVTRLEGYDFADAKGLIDRALKAKNTGKVAIDLKSFDPNQGNDWLRDAASALPQDRVILDTSSKVLMNIKNVIGYAGWGSNDPERKTRHLGFIWLPGAVMTEYVSTNARTFKRPPANWTIGSWKDKSAFFGGSPQTLTADYVHDGVTGASGHVNEPYLQFTPRPNILLPVYESGRNLAESYYLAIPALSWQNVVIGDPLCALGKPAVSPKR